MTSNAHYRYDHGMDNISLYTQTEDQRRGMHMNICWDWNVNVVSKYNYCAIFAIHLQHPHTSRQHNLGKTVNSSLESVGRIAYAYGVKRQAVDLLSSLYRLLPSHPDVQIQTHQIELRELYC